MAGLPTRRKSVSGTDLDGRQLEFLLIVAKQLYRCPGCKGSIEVGSDHVLVKVMASPEGPYHQHWHSDCARGLLRQLQDVRIGEPARRRVSRKRR